MKTWGWALAGSVGVHALLVAPLLWGVSRAVSPVSVAVQAPAVFTRVSLTSRRGAPSAEAPRAAAVVRSRTVAAAVGRADLVASSAATAPGASTAAGSARALTSSDGERSTTAPDSTKTPGSATAPDSATAPNSATTPNSATASDSLRAATSAAATASGAPTASASPTAPGGSTALGSPTASGGSTASGTRTGGSTSSPDRASDMVYARLAALAERCYPAAARRFRQRGTVELGFCTDARGGTVSSEVKHSSGAALLDAAAKGCVIEGAAPFPLEAASRCFSVPVRFGAQ